jgi:ubiquinone/menaquinone biosynthesis C-methylase UbiE
MAEYAAMEGSISFERAATYYDRTRVTDSGQLGADLDVLDGILPPGRALEIGVGTGAIAVPLAARGRQVVGLDLSAAMLAQLRSKQGGGRVAIAVGDATRLPLGDASVAGAYCRWVLHLIQAWRTAVLELARVCARPGVVIVEPGGYTGEWRRVYERFVDELGPDAGPVGLRTRDGFGDLDAAMDLAGGAFREMVETGATLDVSLETFLQQVGERRFSWTWRLPQERLEAAIPNVRAWAVERYGPDLDRPFDPDAHHRWRVYDLA